MEFADPPKAGREKLEFSALEDAGICVPMRVSVLLFVAVGCSSPSFDIGANADSGTPFTDSSPDGVSEAASSPDADGSCDDSPPCATPSGTSASLFDYAPNTPGPVRLDATHQHRLSLLMDRDGRIERFVLRIKPPAAVAEEYLSVEVFASICSKETLLGEQTQSVSSSGDYSFIFDGTGAASRRSGVGSRGGTRAGQGSPRRSET